MSQLVFFFWFLGLAIVNFYFMISYGPSNGIFSGFLGVIMLAAAGYYLQEYLK